MGGAQQHVVLALALLTGELLLGLPSLDMQCNLARGIVTGAPLTQAFYANSTLHAQIQPEFLGELQKDWALSDLPAQVVLEQPALVKVNPAELGTRDPLKTLANLAICISH